MAINFPASPTTGQLFSANNGVVYSFDGIAWSVVSPGNRYAKVTYVATAEQTTFSANYTVGAVDVYKNGLRLSTTAFSATNGTTIVLNSPATLADEIEIVSYPILPYADAVAKSGDTMSGQLNVQSMSISSTLTANSSVGIPGQVLTSNGSGGSPYWAPTVAGATGGGEDKIFWQNQTTIANNYTVPENFNAGSFGPIAIANNVTVTVSSGSVWAIV